MADGEHIVASWVVVTKGRLYGGRFVIAPGADARNDGLRIVALRQARRRDTLRHAAALLLGFLPRLPDTRILCATEARIDDGGWPLQMNGDAAGLLPVETASSATPIRIVVP